MKKIQELLLESEQLRLETDDAGPQDELEYWKSRAARLTLLVRSSLDLYFHFYNPHIVQVEQINTHPCKMTLVTLRAAQSKLLKVREVLHSTILFSTIMETITKNTKMCRDIFLVFDFITF